MEFRRGTDREEEEEEEEDPSWVHELPDARMRKPDEELGPSSGPETATLAMIYPDFSQLNEQLLLLRDITPPELYHQKYLVCNVIPRSTRLSVRSIINRSQLPQCKGRAPEHPNPTHRRAPRVHTSPIPSIQSI